jgi:hypothetical protein
VQCSLHRALRLLLELSDHSLVRVRQQQPRPAGKVGCYLSSCARPQHICCSPALRAAVWPDQYTQQPCFAHVMPCCKFVACMQQVSAQHCVTASLACRLAHAALLLLLPPAQPSIVCMCQLVPLSRSIICMFKLKLC